MRGRARAWLAVLLAVAAVLGASAAERLGPAAPAAATPGVAVSSAWLCPHGGGEDWVGRIAIANPGDEPVQARLVSLGAKHERVIAAVDVPAGAEVLQAVPADTRATSTAVEIFGGWAAVGWFVKAGGAESGVGAEACTPDAGDHWTVVDGVTTQHVHSYVVVMNPFASDAVIDVTLYLPDRPPVRDPDWTDLRVAAGHSVALDLKSALGKKIVGADISASRGRVGVASLVIDSGDRVRSVLASPAYSSRWILPVGGGTGEGTLSLLVPGDLGIQFGAVQLAPDTAAHPAGNLTVIQQGGTSTLSAPISTSGASAVVVQVQDGDVVAAGLREAGPDTDDAATGGTALPAPAWVVLPTSLGRDPKPSLVLVNPGEQMVTATLTMLREDGVASPAPITVEVPAGRTVGVPGTFLQADPKAAIVVQASGDLVALGAGVTGIPDRFYAMAMGAPMPSGAAAVHP